MLPFEYKECCLLPASSESPILPPGKPLSLFIESQAARITTTNSHLLEDPAWSLSLSVPRGLGVVHCASAQILFLDVISYLILFYFF